MNYDVRLPLLVLWLQASCCASLGAAVQDVILFGLQAADGRNILIHSAVKLLLMLSELLLREFQARREFAKPSVQRSADASCNSRGRLRTSGDSSSRKIVPVLGLWQLMRSYSLLLIVSMRTLNFKMALLRLLEHLLNLKLCALLSFAHQK